MGGVVGVEVWVCVCACRRVCVHVYLHVCVCMFIKEQSHMPQFGVCVYSLVL